MAPPAPRAIAVVSVVLAVLGVASCAATGPAASRHDRRDFPVAGQRLTIQSPHPDLRVVPGSSGQVTVERWLSGKAARDGHAEWSMRGHTLRVNYSCSGFTIDCAGRARVTVPRDLALTVRSTYGEINIVGSVRALDVDSEHGDATVAKPTGALRVRSTYGRVTVDGARSSRADVRTEHDIVDLTFATPPDRVRATSTYGAVHLRLPATDGGYRLATGSRFGRVHTAVRTYPDSDRYIAARSTHADVRLRTN